MMKNYADEIIKILNKSYYIYNILCSCVYCPSVKYERRHAVKWESFFLLMCFAHENSKMKRLEIQNKGKTSHSRITKHKKFSSRLKKYVSITTTTPRWQRYITMKVIHQDDLEHMNKTNGMTVIHLSSRATPSTWLWAGVTCWSALEHNTEDSRPEASPGCT